MTEILQAAIDYTRVGWYVIPLRGKIPLIKGWPTNASLDPDVLANWWHTWPSSNVGIVTGKLSQIIVLDIDPKNGGDRTIAGLIAKHGALPTNTPAALTGGGGWHYIFAHPNQGAIENAVNLRGWNGLDIRADGGQIVAAPSIHPDTGKAYSWLPGQDPRLCSPQQAPAWLLDALRSTVARPPLPGPGDAIHDGQRDETLFRLGAKLRGEGLEEAEILAELRKVNATRCRPPLPDSVVVQKAAQAAKYERGPTTEGLADFMAPERPVIVISTNEPKVNKSAIEALSKDPDIYSRNQRLVTILGATEDTKSHKSLSLPPETPIVHNLCNAVIQESLAGAAQWCALDGRSQEMLPKHPPAWTVQAIAGRGAWPQIRPLRGIVDYPIVRNDGSVCCKPGYDMATGYYLGNVPQLNIYDRPTQQDATFAADKLLELLVDFPIRDPSTASAWLALLLTTIARPAIYGPTPLFVIDANVRGAGKTFLADLVGSILVGRALPAFGHTTDQAELEKILISIARLALPIVNLDNVTASLGGGVLDRWITSTAPAGRTLGASEVQTYDWNTVLSATCNNARIHGDTDRRIIFLLLESDLERPETRTGFRYPDIQGHIAAHRDEYLTAALTILRAHAVAGRPRMGGNPKGSFESWCSIVRDAVMFAGCPDCERAPDDPGRPEDEDTTLLNQLLPALQQAFGERPFLVRHALLKAWPEDRMDDPDLQLQDALSALAFRGDKPTPQGLGKTFSKMSRRWLGGKQLDKCYDNHSKQTQWVVKTKCTEVSKLH